MTAGRQPPPFQQQQNENCVRQRTCHAQVFGWRFLQPSPNLSLAPPQKTHKVIVVIVVIVFSVIIIGIRPRTCFHHHQALTYIRYVEGEKFVVLTGASDCFELDKQVAI